MTDVIIIGGGPAGSAAAIRLAQIGMNVRLYEKSRFPRPKLCGGFLSPESLMDLAQLGVLERIQAAGALPVRRTVVSSPAGQIAVAPLPAPGLSLSREKLDLILLQQARDAGVEVHEGTDGFAQEPKNAWTIVTTGRKPHPKDEAYYGLQAFFENVNGISDQVELDIVKTGYVGLVQQDNGLVNICALIKRQLFKESGALPDAALDVWKTQNPLLRERLRGARRITRWMAVGPVKMGLRQLSAPATLYSGDAACVVDPFAGEGIAMALRSAALMQQAFQQREQSVERAYATAWHREFDSSLRFHQWTRRVMHARTLHETLVLGLRAFPPLLTWLTEQTRPKLYAS